MPDLDTAGPAADLFTRSPGNPLLTAADWPYPVNAVLNPGAAEVAGETVLLCRVEDRRGVSHLSVARSGDGVTGWRIAPKPLIGPDDLGNASAFGVEDPRITRLDEMEAWLIAYTAYGPSGPCVALAVTEDFRTVEHVGVAIPPEDKNAALLPDRIDGSFILFHRPTSPASGRADVWLSRSTDLRSWTAPEPVLAARPGPWWDGVRVGIGPPPLRSGHGWLALYHGVKQMATGGAIYRTGVALLDLWRPAHVVRRSDDWILAPVAPYERMGDAPNVVFPTGLIHDVENDLVRLYYGAADSHIGLATASYRQLVAYACACPTSSFAGQASR